MGTVNRKSHLTVESLLSGDLTAYQSFKTTDEMDLELRRRAKDEHLHVAQVIRKILAQALAER